MTTRGSLAFAHARVRAAKSRLLTRTDAAPLFTASDSAAMTRVVSALGVEDPFARLVRIYETAIRGYRDAAPLLRALAGLHEIENVKLLWRCVVKRRHVPHLWIDLGSLATIEPLDALTPHELAEGLAHTPYASIAATVARTHGRDIAAAELAFDRWASQRVLNEARKLPRRESLARRLVEMFVRERDSEIIRRGAQWYGLTSVGAAAPGVEAMRRERLRVSRRAFIGSPFLLAPAIAVIFLAEEEVRAVRALVEREGDEQFDEPMLRAIAGSQIGAR
jgi:hypothetical protein